ncbi:polysaccharide deacetylase family protein [Salinarimonas chemoclinalis]|uniref:polysaccharide deacetylase family protein n=1 Tax=Salinarimonas chemoclinalis TaxID=3241599 RepID=UPI0035571199
MGEQPPSLPSWRWPEADWRALVGRVRAGRRLRPPSWNGKRCAVALSFDCDHETFEMGAGGRAMGRIAWGEFGRRVGVPRILDLLARHDVPASFFVPAVCALIDPDEPRRIAARGHEIGIHGWIHENNSLIAYEDERALMERARDVLRDASGTEPVGLRSANWDLSPDTIRIVREMGLLYDSSMMADEEPYELLLDGAVTGVVEIPVEWLRDDAVYLLFNRNPPTRPYTPPAAVLDIFLREFDAAWEEGGVFQLVMHPFVIGYRSRIFILDELIRHAKAKGDVWFCTHADLARHARDHAPASAQDSR